MRHVLPSPFADPLQIALQVVQPVLVLPLVHLAGTTFTRI
jgi:hypothetical protein